VVKTDPQKDLSLLRASCPLPSAQLSKTPAQPGDKVIATGYPLGSPFVIATDGYVSTLMDISESVKLLAFSAPIASGNSGGPLWLNGQVVGIVVRGHVTYHHISLATPLEAILEFLK
jgi:S1-C subfamily serine protease